jgi:hypothetical protein
MYQDAAGKPECKVCNVVNVTRLYEYLAMTENQMTDDFALTGASAGFVCGTGTYDSDTNSSPVCVDHRICGTGNYTSVRGKNSLNPKCNQCEAGKFKEAESPCCWKSARTVW